MSHLVQSKFLVGEEVNRWWGLRRAGCDNLADDSHGRLLACAGLEYCRGRGFMSDAMLCGFLLVLLYCLVVESADLVWRGICAVVRAFLCWRAFKDVLCGNPIALAVVDGRLYMDGLHPAAPYALWVLRRKAARFVDAAETLSVESAPSAKSPGGLQ